MKQGTRQGARCVRAERREHHGPQSGHLCHGDALQPGWVNGSMDGWAAREAMRPRGHRPPTPAEHRVARARPRLHRCGAATSSLLRGGALARERCPPDPVGCIARCIARCSPIRPRPTAAHRRPRGQALVQPRADHPVPAPRGRPRHRPGRPGPGRPHRRGGRGWPARCGTARCTPGLERPNAAVRVLGLAVGALPAVWRGVLPGHVRELARLGGRRGQRPLARLPLQKRRSRCRR